jgi:hypothetical protein
MTFNIQMTLRKILAKLIDSSWGPPTFELSEVGIQFSQFRVVFHRIPVAKECMFGKGPGVNHDDEHF